jgi:phenylpropionate dioxygenase-like ring-hydroxylating dioxygenase large terminal subunit
MTRLSPIPLSDLATSIGGRNASRFFPPSAYTSEAFYRFELAAVWQREWIAVGRCEEIPATGDYFTISIGDEPLIVIRDEDEIHAMSAVCRHRGTVIVDGTGHCRGGFVCPYHNWTYDRRGNLVGAPDMAGFATFDKSKNGLPRIRTEIWQGIVFVNFDTTAPPLTPRFASLDPIVHDWRLPDLRDESVVDPEIRKRFDYAWNWKIYAEGQSECYHCDKLHGDTPTMQGMDFSSMKMLVEEPDNGVFSFSVRTKTIDHTLNHLGRANLPAIPTLPEEQRWLSYAITIAPNIFMQLMSDSVILVCWFPRGPQSMQMKRFRLYPETTLQMPDFIEKRGPEHVAARYFVSQDDFAFERVQQGLRSQFAPRGPVSTKEPILGGFNKWLLDRYTAYER